MSVSNSGEANDVPCQSRPPSLNLGQFGNTPSINPEARFEPIVTSAVLASGENHTSLDNNMEVSEEESIEGHHRYYLREST
jgi:hypothetical protein